ncbi:hypothetical protein PIB30_099030 [Stylosanthes scabra]|uniref:Uncharacterized protein n=1 Tax=Stylosanthes scabra TaxID=79078 RepID=A0ABU6TZ81_9FABA|nr:hypothetical protein [Stylosanthes scabra]
MILIPASIIPDGETTLTLVGEETRIKEATTSKTTTISTTRNLPPPAQPNSFEAALEKLTLTTAGFVQTTKNFIEEARANLRNQESAIRNLETQVAQIAKQLSTTLPNAFASDTEVNPKAHA